SALTGRDRRDVAEEEPDGAAGDRDVARVGRGQELGVARVLDRCDVPRHWVDRPPTTIEVAVAGLRLSHVTQPVSQRVDLVVRGGGGPRSGEVGRGPDRAIEGAIDVEAD